MTFVVLLIFLVVDAITDSRYYHMWTTIVLSACTISGLKKEDLYTLYESLRAEIADERPWSGMSVLISSTLDPTQKKFIKALAKAVYFVVPD